MNCCESCEDFRSRVWVRILIVLAVLVAIVTGYALYLAFGNPLVATASVWLLGAPVADRLAAMGEGA